LTTGIHEMRHLLPFKTITFIAACPRYPKSGCLGLYSGFQIMKGYYLFLPMNGPKSIEGSTVCLERGLLVIRRTSRDVTRLHGARDKKQVWSPHGRNWGLSEANALYWRKYLWHCWDFSAPREVIRRPNSDSPGELRPLSPLVTPLPTSSSTVGNKRESSGWILVDKYNISSCFLS